MHTIELDIDNVFVLFELKHLIHSNLFDGDEEGEGEEDDIKRLKSRASEKEWKK